MVAWTSVSVSVRLVSLSMWSSLSHSPSSSIPLSPFPSQVSFSKCKSFVLIFNKVNSEVKYYIIVHKDISNIVIQGLTPSLPPSIIHRSVIHPFIPPSRHLSFSLSIILYIRLLGCPSIHRSVQLSVWLCDELPICPSGITFICAPISSPACLSLGPLYPSTYTSKVIKEKKYCFVYPCTCQCGWNEGICKIFQKWMGIIFFLFR